MIQYDTVEENTDKWDSKHTKRAQCACLWGKAQMPSAKVLIYSSHVKLRLRHLPPEKKLWPALRAPSTELILLSAVYNYLINFWVCVWPEMQ